MKAMTIFLAFLFLLPGLQTAAAQDAPGGAWTGVTVLLADGWRYRDVTVYLDELGAGLWINRSDGAERLVPTDQVARIIGPDGADVTGAVLGGRRAAVAAPQTPPAPDGAIVPATTVATEPPSNRPFKLAFTLEGGYGFPMGELYDSYQPSWSAGARLRVGTTQKSYLGFGYRYQDLGTVGSFSDASAHLAIYEGSFGWMGDAVGNRPRSYFELGAAFVEHTVTYSIEQDTGRYSRNYGSFLMRTGVLIPFGEGFALDLGFSWTYRGLIFADEHESAGSLIGVHLGLTWMN